MRASTLIECLYHFVPDRISLRIKLTFYICAAVLMCMGIMAAICITISLNITQNLMSQRLAYFASIKAEQTERGLQNEAMVLDTILQGDLFTSTLQSVYYGNITSREWAFSMNSLISEMFTTNLRPIQLITFYDVRGNILFSSRNPMFSNDSVSQLRNGLSTLFPLGHTINVTTDSSQISNTTSHNNATFFLNQTFEAANSSQLEAFAAQAAIDASESQNSSTAMGKADTAYKPPIEFVQIERGVYNWMAPPVPIYNSSGEIGAYSMSLTTPMNHLQIKDSVQSSTLIGYCTAVMDASKYMNGSFTLESDSYSTDTNKFRLAVIGITNEFWKFIFPTNPYEFNKLHPLYTFPAVQASGDLWRKTNKKNGGVNNPGGAMMSTQAPGISRASVGYSYVNALGNEWIIAVSVPRADVEQGYWIQIHKLIGVLFGILAFCALAALLSTNLIVNPLIHINRGMELQPREFNHKQSNHPFNIKAPLWITDTHQSTATWGVEDISGNEQSSSVNSHASSATITAEMESSVHPKNGTNSPATNTTHSNDTAYDDMETIAEVHTSTGDEFEEDETEVFRIPAKIAPLNRWFVDEVDGLIEVYNCLVDRLVGQHTKVEDEVRLRTREARESQRLAETANAAKSRFMMNISHELLTPMNGIMGITAVSIEEERLPEMYAGLRTILNSGNILQELLNELLTYAAHLAGIEHSIQQFSLGKLATSIEDTFRNRAGLKGVDFKVNISPPSLGECLVESDFERIMHICTSIVSNAIKFSDLDKRKDFLPQPLKLTVNAEEPPCFPRVWIDILLRKPDKYVDIPVGDVPPERYAMLEIVVNDSGVGISKHKLAHIFEVFEQGEDALSKHFTGTGIGLAISKLLCEALGGSISVSSCEFVGTIVELRVPIYTVNEQNIENRPSLPLVFNSLAPHQVVWRTNTKKTQLVQLSNSTGKLRRNSRSWLTISHRANRSESSHSIFTTQTPVSGLNVPTAAPVTTHNGRQECAKEGETSNVENFRLAGLESLQVLIVEDNQILRGLYKKMLEKIGVGKVDTAINGEEGVERVEKAIVKGTRYQLIFMDLEMPKKSGVETAQFIWKQLGYASPIVALTGHSDKKTQRECTEMGFSRVLVKPVNQTELRDTIAELSSEMRMTNLTTDPTSACVVDTAAK